MGKKRRRERQLQQQRDSQEVDQRSCTLTEATDQRRVLDWIKRHLRPLGTHLLVLVFGSGVVWQCFQLSIQWENQANDIRKEIIILQEKMIHVTNSMNEANLTLSGGEREDNCGLYKGASTSSLKSTAGPPRPHSMCLVVPGACSRARRPVRR